MIYTVTLNPAIDYYLTPETMTGGKTNRSLEESFRFGGKGINVSVVLARLGVETTALGFAAGFTGDALLKSVAQTGIRTDFTVLSDDGSGRRNTRINVKLLCFGTQTEINAAGPCVSEKELEPIDEKLDRAQPGDTVVLSGSLPSGLPKNTYAEIMKRHKDAGLRFAVDTSREALAAVLPFRPFVIKPNRDELEELCGETLSDDADILRAAVGLQSRGARNVLVSLGAAGALLLEENGTSHRMAAPAGTARGTVGAGDSMLAGYLSAVSYGARTALRYAVAAGSATAFCGELAQKAEIERLALSLKD